MASTSALTSNALRIGIVVLTLITAAVHISLIFPDAVFILNGLGYLTLLAALYLPINQLVPYRRALRWLLIGYTALTVALWLAIGERTALGVFTTADEIVLITLLVLQSRRRSA